MLILTRKVEQGIIIDGTTIVRVLAIDGERVKMGIDAPPEIGVLREELVQQVAGENREASGARGHSLLVDRLRSLDRRDDRAK